jgi:hypothetical protein
VEAHGGLHGLKQRPPTHEKPSRQDGTQSVAAVLVEPSRFVVWARAGEAIITSIAMSTGPMYCPADHDGEWLS